MRLGRCKNEHAALVWSTAFLILLISETVQVQIIGHWVSFRMTNMIIRNVSNSLLISQKVWEPMQSSLICFDPTPYLEEKYIGCYLLLLNPW